MDTRINADPTSDPSYQNEFLLALRLRHFRTTADLFEATISTRILEKAGESRTPDKWFSDLVQTVDFGFNVPNLFRRSLFIGAYSLFEHHLNAFTTDLRTKNSLQLRLEDLHGQGIARAKLYLKKVLGHPFPDESQEWAQLKRFGELRNVLVHRYGRIDPAVTDKALIDWITKTPDLGFLPLANAIWMDAGFVVDVLTTIERFFSLMGYDLARWQDDVATLQQSNAP